MTLTLNQSTVTVAELAWAKANQQVPEAAQVLAALRIGEPKGSSVLQAAVAAMRKIHPRPQQVADQLYAYVSKKTEQRAEALVGVMEPRTHENTKFVVQRYFVGFDETSAAQNRETVETLRPSFPGVIELRRFVPAGVMNEAALDRYPDPHRDRVIKEVWAFISEEPQNGDETILSWAKPNPTMPEMPPMVVMGITSNLRDLQKMLPAVTYARQQGVKVELRSFAFDQMIDETSLRNVFDDL